jgi:hypothetical protein
MSVNHDNESLSDSIKKSISTINIRLSIIMTIEKYYNLISKYNIFHTKRHW